MPKQVSGKIPGTPGKPLQDEVCFVCGKGFSVGEKPVRIYNGRYVHPRCKKLVKGQAPAGAPGKPAR